VSPLFSRGRGRRSVDLLRSAGPCRRRPCGRRSAGTWPGTTRARAKASARCGRKVVSNSGVVPSERCRKFGLSAGANEIRNLGLAVYGPRRGRAANRHLARGLELNTGPQPVVLGSPFGSTPAETFVRVGPGVGIRFPPGESPLRTCPTRLAAQRGSVLRSSISRPAFSRRSRS